MDPTQHHFRVADGELFITAPSGSDLHRILRSTGTGLRWDAPTRTWACPAHNWAIVAGWCTVNSVPGYPVPPLNQSERCTVTRRGNIFHITTSATGAISRELLVSKVAVPYTTNDQIEWTVHVRYAAPIAAIVARHDITQLDHFADVGPRWTKQAHTNIDMATRVKLPEDATIPAIRGLTSTLMEQQKVSIALLHANGCLINADEQGLGKTIQGLAAARVQGNEAQRFLIVCPSSLTTNWASEIDEHFAPDTFHPYMATGRTTTPIPDNVDTVIIGWPNLHYWLDTLADWNPDLAVFDEAHYAKKVAIGSQEGTERAAAYLTICEHVVAHPNGRVCALTGTPVSNRPVELLPLLQSTGIIAYFGGTDKYLNRYCDPKNTPSGTIYKGSSNAEELHTLLKASGHYLRRTKQHLVETGVLKPKFVDGAEFYSGAEEHPILIKGDPLVMGRYYRARRDIINYLIAEIRKKNPRASGDYIKRKLSSPRAKEFSELATLRKLAAEAKAPYVIRLIDDLIAKGEKVVVAAHHREIVDLFATRYGDCRIQGGMSQKKIDAAKLRFNSQPVEECPVLVLAVEAGKTGHTLCKQPQYPAAGPTCARMILAEQIWVPGDEAQTQDRIWRIGQDREVHIANVLVEDTTDTMIYGVRKKKQEVVSTVTDGVITETAGAGMLFAHLYDQVINEAA